MFAGDGEPLLNPEINEIIKDATEHHIDTSFTTNGVHIKDDFIEEAMRNVSWIKVSINAGSAKVYKHVHRTSENDFAKVWRNLEKAVNYRSTNQDSVKTAIGIQSLILPDNIDSLEGLASRAVNAGLDYLVLKPYVHNVYMEQPGYIDIDYTQKSYKETISKIKDKYESDLFKVVSRENALSKLLGETERYQKCWSTPALWFYISGDGSVYACGAHVGNPNFLLGNINDELIENIWRSDKRKNCLYFVQEELDLNDCRRTCRMDEVNAYLSKVIDAKPDHVNFI
jgi:radical SAM protein with 4Fe4S-binding SPASM domain